MIRQHSSNSLTLSKLGKLGSYATLCFGCHKKRLGASSKRPSNHRKCYIQCKSECMWPGSTFQHPWKELWVRVKSCVTFLCNI